MFISKNPIDETRYRQTVFTNQSLIQQKTQIWIMSKMGLKEVSEKLLPAKCAMNKSSKSALLQLYYEWTTQEEETQKNNRQKFERTNVPEEMIQNFDSSQEAHEEIAKNAKNRTKLSKIEVFCLLVNDLPTKSDCITGNRKHNNSVTESKQLIKRNKLPKDAPLNYT